MREIIAAAQGAFTGIGGWIGWYLGGYDGLIYALVAFVAVDCITGVMCAFTTKTLSSAVGFLGLFRKILILLFVGIGYMLDTNIIGSGSVLRTAIIFFYLSNEGISILENAAILGLPVPDKLRAVLAQLQEDETTDVKDGDGHDGV